MNGQPVTLAAYESQVARYSTSMAAAGQDLDTPEDSRSSPKGASGCLAS